MTAFNSDNRNDNGAQTVRKALVVLDALRDLAGSQRLADLAASTGMSPTVVHRLLVELKAAGLVEQVEGSREYRLGIGVLSYASAVLRRSGLVTVGPPIARSIRDEWSETVTLQIRSGAERVVVFEAEGLHDLRHRAPIGQRMPLYSNASGRAIMAFLSDDEIDRALAAPFRQYTERTLTSPGEIREQLHAIRESGLATAQNQTRLGIASIATPIFGLTEEPVGSLAVSGPSARLGEAPPELAGAVLAAGLEISRRLGFHGQPPWSGQ